MTWKTLRTDTSPIQVLETEVRSTILQLDEVNPDEVQ